MKKKLSSNEISSLLKKIIYNTSNVSKIIDHVDIIKSSIKLNNKPNINNTNLLNDMIIKYENKLKTELENYIESKNNILVQKLKNLGELETLNKYRYNEKKIKRYNKKENDLLNKLRKKITELKNLL
jgi:hypothetical protein